MVGRLRWVVVWGWEGVGGWGESRAAHMTAARKKRE